MARTTSSSNGLGRNNGSAGPFLLSRDRFKEKAEKLAARKGAKPAGDAFVARPAASKGTIRVPTDVPAPAPREAPPAPPRRTWTLANGAALQVVASQPETAEVKIAERDEKRIERRAAKSSSFVLVSSSTVVEAPAPAAVDGGQGELAIPKLARPKPNAKPKRSGGGGGGGSGGGDGGGAAAPRDRLFNQDDLAGVLVVLAVLLLIGLYLVNLFRGNGATAVADEEIVGVQSASAAPVEPAGPLPDPYGNQAIDLTPESPLPPEPAAVAAAPPPASEPAAAPAAAAAPSSLDVRVHAYFCTDRSELTPASAEALDKEIAAWGDRIAGKNLVVAGYADTRGEAVYNTWLGGERAKAVVNYLTAKGFRATALAVGELPDLADNENCANQRRVDVRLADAPEETPSRSCAPPPELAALACLAEPPRPAAVSEPAAAPEQAPTP
jgi:outer membrane protein OmpA-like peptidoglycan-associated protein